MTMTDEPKQTATGGYTAHINNIEIYYEDYGAGGSGQNWYPFRDKLSERYRLIVVDLRGHGYSTISEGKFTHREAANDVLLLLDGLKIRHFSAMGMSSGGMTLLHMAASQPKRIDSMVLVSATTHFPDEARAIMRRASFATMPKQVQEMYTECAKRGHKQIQQLVSQFNALGGDHEDMNFTAGDLSTIDARTLIIHGDRDRFFPVEIPVSIYRSIPDAALWIIPGGDHVPIYDSMVPFTTTVLGFLNGIENTTEKGR